MRGTLLETLTCEAAGGWVPLAVALQELNSGESAPLAGAEY